jgi:hypothetical protein
MITSRCAISKTREAFSRDALAERELAPMKRRQGSTVALPSAKPPGRG